MNRIIIFLLIGSTFACGTQKNRQDNVVTADINNFWRAYDLVVNEADTLRQIELFDSVYVQQGTLGLDKIMQVRNYTAEEYVELINRYPKYWNSVRDNTFKSKDLTDDLNSGIEKLKKIYPELKPAKIYFTIGAMRTNGTVQDSLVLIGSELAMADSTTVISEFEGRTREWLETFFSSSPIDGLVLLNVHEYVHTQQHPIPDNLLHMVLYEGIAEFVSVTAMETPSNTPAIAFGRSNPAVRKKFEQEMFYGRTYDWLWSNTPNEFGVRDLGYYIGYAIAEKHYEKSTDKRKAIEELIELDYSKASGIDAFIDRTGYFSKPIAILRKEDRKRRPKVLRINQFENGAIDVDPDTRQITIKFSEKLNGYNTGVDYSELGENAFPDVSNRFWSADSTSWTLEVELEPNNQYKFWITNNFRFQQKIHLKCYFSKSCRSLLQQPTLKTFETTN